ncbi:MAG TPA: 1,3-beta-glucanase, partial [Candidatus Dormibacteraeota bacterium]|nr:1,3-beta-glucanase [Candidatus Dormibacteraeota bacterium]
MQMFSYEGQVGTSHQPYKRLFLWLATMLIIGTLLSAALSVGPLSGTASAKAGGWRLIWSDEFNGAAGTGVNTANWIYDTGTGYSCAGCPSNWGTGEVETMTSSTANVYQDGAGHLAIKPIRSANGTWYSGRIETQRTDFAAPVGGKLA